MPRYHLRFKRFRQPLLDTTQEFFDSHPWAGTADEQHAKFTSWLQGSASVYGTEVPTLYVMSGEQLVVAAEQGWFPDVTDIVVDKFSALTLFYKFRMFAIETGAVQCASRSPREDAAGWACSLFYKFKPILFRKAVRSGQVQVPISKEDLLTQDTLQQIRDLRLAGHLADAEALLNGEQPSALNDDEAEAFEGLAAQLTGNDDAVVTDVIVTSPEEELVVVSVPDVVEEVVANTTPGPWTELETLACQKFIDGDIDVETLLRRIPNRTRGAVMAKVRRMRNAG